MPGTTFSVKFNLEPTLSAEKLNVFLTHLKNSLGKLGKDINLIDANKLNQDLAAVQKTMNGATSQANGFAGALEKARNNGGAFMKAFNFNQIAQSVQFATQALNQFMNPFVQFDKQLKNVATLGVKDIDALGDKINELAKRSPDSAAQIAEGVYQAYSAGLQGSQEDIVKFVETAGKAAVAGISDTKSAVDGLTSVLNAYKMSAADADKVSSTFFSAIKLGKTSFPELNASIATFVPLAAASKVSFEQMTSALATMTTMGTPTSMAATQIRAALVLIQKGGPGLNKALKEQGRSLQEFQQMLAKPVKEGGGFINTLQAIREVIDQSGQTLPQATGRIEAANAILQLTGDNLEKAKDTYVNATKEISAGAADLAYEEAAQSVEVKSKIIANKIQGFFNDAFKAVGAGATTMINVFNQVGPAILGLSVMKNIFPTGLIKNVNSFASAILTRLVPSLAASTTATGAQAAATGTATAAQSLFNKVVAANPILAIVGATIALGTALYFLSDALNVTAEERYKDLQAEKEELNQKQKLMQAQMNLQQSSLDLVDEYEKLGAKANLTANEQKRLDEVTLELSKRFPGAISSTQSYADNLKNLEVEANGARTTLKELRDQMDEMEGKKIQLDVELAKTNVDKIQEELADTLDSNNFFKPAAQRLSSGLAAALEQGTSEVDIEKIYLNYMTDVLSKEKDFENASATERSAIWKKAAELKDAAVQEMKTKQDAEVQQTEQYANKIKAINEQIAADKKAIDSGEAGTQQKITYQENIKAQEQAYAELTSKVQEMKKALASGDFINAEKLKNQVQGAIKIIGETDFNAGPLFGKIQTEFKTALTSGVVDAGKENSKKVQDQLKQIIDEYNNAGDDLSRSKIAEKLKNMKLVPDDLIGDINIEGPMGMVVKGFQLSTDKLEEYIKKQDDAVKNSNTYISGMFNDIGSEIKKANINKLLNDAFKIKESVTQQTNLQKLVENYNKATDDIQKHNIAAAIAKQAPELVRSTGMVVDETTGKLVENYEVLTDKVEAYTETQKKALEGSTAEVMTKTNKYLSDQGKILSDNTSKMAALRTKINALSSTGLDTTELQKQYNDLSKQQNNSITEITAFLKKMKDSGIDTEGAFKNIADAIGVTPDKLQKMIDKQQESNDLAEEQVSTIESLGKAWNSAANEVSASIKSNLDALAQIRLQRKKGVEVTEEQKQQEQESAEALKQAVKQQKEMKSITDQLNKQYGLTETKGKTLAQSLSQQFSIQKNLIKNEKETNDLTAEKNRLLEGRSKSLADEILEHNRVLQAAKDEKKAFEDIYKVTDGKIGVNINGDDLVKAQQQLDDLGNNIKKLENKSLEFDVKIKANKDKLQEELYNLKLNQLKFDIELGIKKPEDLIRAIKDEVLSVETQIVGKEEELLQLKGMKQTPETLAKISVLESDIVKLKQKKLDKTKELNSEEQKQLDKKKAEYQQEYSNLVEKNNKELDEIQRRNEAEKRIRDSLIGTAEGIFNKKTTDEYNNQVKKLEKIKEQGIITDEELNKRKQKLEEEHQKKMTAIQNAALGQRLEAERQQTLSLLLEQQTRLDAELRMQLSRPENQQDQQEIKNLQKRLNDTIGQITDAQDILKYHSEEFKTSIAEIFSGMFADDEEFKKPWRKILTIAAGGLKEYLELLVTELVFGELSKYAGSTGFTALVLIPAFRGIARAALSAIIDPIINSVASFSTSGVADNPTLAVVGDAKKSGSKTNREYILWEEHIYKIIDIVLNKYNEKIFGVLGDNMSVQGFKDMQMGVLTSEIRALSTAIDKLRPFMGSQNMIASKLVDVLKASKSKLELERSYRNFEIPDSEYVKSNQILEVKVKSSAGGSPPVYSPELHVIGDAGVNNPEVVLNSPELQALMVQAASVSSALVAGKLDDVIQAIRDLEGRIYILEDDIGQSTNRYNNRNTKVRSRVIE